MGIGLQTAQKGNFFLIDLLILKIYFHNKIIQIVMVLEYQVDVVSNVVREVK